MRRRGKMLALAALTTIAASAAMASGASAEAEFTAAEYPATVLGTGEQEIILGFHKIKCKFVLLRSELKAKSKSKTQVVESLTECTMTVGGNEFPAKVQMNGCDWLYPDAQKPEKDLKCPNGKDVDIFVYESVQAEEEEKAICTYHAAEQSELGTVEFQNTTGSPEDVLAIDELSGISYTATGPILICGSSGSGAEFHAETTSIATNEEEEEIAYMVG